MSCKSIVIDGIEYKPTKPVDDGAPVKIVVLQRGWVVVGYFSQIGDMCSLTNASVIRNWGTSKGLGEIAADGPKKDTKLDPCNGLVEFHQLTIVMTITAEKSEWSKHLK